ncbi:sugar phosphate isomerase/epimerase family protein [Aeoliella sp.]|uniref:sugar phosphate isomerase/epimerase family protein n=1 Tax=Aeoliella sp. TaxID=2795800 RepID=UPI003CCC1416
MNQPIQHEIDRRGFLAAMGVAAAGQGLSPAGFAKEPADGDAFELRYMLASCMYGFADLSDVLVEVPKVGSKAIDLWPKKHGNQREQLDEMGEERFAELLAEHEVTLGCLTRYHADPEILQGEMRLAQRLKCPLVVSAAKGLPDIDDKSIKGYLQHFFDEWKPQIAVAEECGVTLALENHGGNPIDSPDSLRWFVELRPSKHIALALSPYYLEQDGEQIAQIVRDTGEGIALFYAWQHGLGSKQKRPLEEELLQMPGRGPLDFGPIVEALRDINYRGWTEIFMHPYPRGRPILPTIDQTTAEINRSRSYLAKGLKN